MTSSDFINVPPSGPNSPVVNDLSYLKAICHASKPADRGGQWPPLWAWATTMLLHCDLV